MRTKSFYWLLMAAVVLGLGLSATACSDDDENQIEEKTEPDSAEGLSGTVQEENLKYLISRWCDVSDEELTGDLASKTFEATEGTVIDESQPRVRSIQVDSIEVADDYAISVLSRLGIDCMHPDGFSYTDAAVGTISYRHSSEDNTLAVIDVNIKQIPGLQQIRMVKTMPENANDKPYYTLGDIIKYKNRYYVCTSEHKYKEKARFINFTNDVIRPYGTFNWAFVGKDTVYNESMASFETIAGWIEDILLCDSIYIAVYSRMGAYGDLHQMNQIIPEKEDVRIDLVVELFNLKNRVFSVHTPNTPLPKEFYYKENPRGKDLYIYAPFGLMLANKLRWSEGFTWDQWVPYVHCVWDREFGKFYEKTIEDESQTTLSPKHFKWQAVKAKKHRRYDIRKGGFSQKDQYWICLSAYHWRHESIKVGIYGGVGQDFREETNALFNFTKNKLNHPMAAVKQEANKIPDAWSNFNITSLEVTETDKGKANSDFQPVYIHSVAAH